MGKDYNSPEYYAREFWNFLQDSQDGFVCMYGFIPEARQSGNKVAFRLQSRRVRVKFNVREGIPYVSLECEVADTWMKPAKREMPATYELLFQEFIRPYFKEAYLSDNE